MSLGSLAQEAMKDAEGRIEEAKQLIDDLKNCPSEVELAIQVGDLFNGIIGTLAFNSKDSAFEQLVDTARMVDNMGNLYKRDDFSEVSEDHIDFLVAASSFSGAVIQCYESGEGISSILSQKSDLVSLYNHLAEVEEKEVLDQSDIDDLLDKLA